MTMCVKVYENGRCIGRATPEGTVTNRNIFALMVNEHNIARVKKMIEEVNSKGDFFLKLDKF